MSETRDRVLQTTDAGAFIVRDDGTDDEAGNVGSVETVPRTRRVGESANAASRAVGGTTRRSCLCDRSEHNTVEGPPDHAAGQGGRRARTRDARGRRRSCDWSCRCDGFFDETRLATPQLPTTTLATTAASAYVGVRARRNARVSPIRGVATPERARPKNARPPIRGLPQRACVSPIRAVAP